MNVQRPVVNTLLLAKKSSRAVLAASSRQPNTQVLPPRRAINGSTSQPGPQGPIPDPTQSEDEPQSKWGDWSSTAFKMAESALTTAASITILGLVGYSYTKWYKHQVLQKIENAFKPGDPYLELAGRGRGPGSETHWIERDEQAQIDAIIDGTDQGHYFLLIGEKGTGKSSMILEAMQRVNGDSISMFDAHQDIEIFRIRLGRALDFEFHEDNIGSLFSIRGPRDASALLDVERAFSKFEKVALRRRNEGRRPLILIINALHLVRDNEDGRALLELLQQKAEQWCASNICTVVLNSDDYWVYERLKQHATRMEVLQVTDLSKPKAMTALRKLRLHWYKELPPEPLLEEVYHRLGGRLSFLARAAKEPDMFAVCDEINQREKTWFLTQCGILGEPMDDDVMDQQKYASAAMVLAKALYERERDTGGAYDPVLGYQLPTIPLHEARQIMTRADFIQDYDGKNIFTINAKAMVRADSVPMQRAFRETAAEDGFDEYLQATLDRISAIESLGRTRELTIKDLWDKGTYRIRIGDGKGRGEKEVVFQVGEKGDDEQDN